MSLPANPWAAARARYGNAAALLRMIDLTAGTDDFHVLRALKDFGESALNDCTVIIGGGGNRSLEERDALIARFDAAWRARQAEQMAKRR